MGDFWQFLVEHQRDLQEQVLEHLWLTLLSVSFSIVAGLSLGVLIVKRKRLAPPVLAVVNGIQTVPSIALLGVLLPFFGIGALPAIIALFLYGLLPIVRNTHAGITGIEPAVIEAAEGMGFSDGQRLFRIELPLAMPVIFAGIRTAVVINIGIATLCALIAAGGLGEFIFRGLSTNNPQMILAGAIPASLMALLFDALLGYLQPRIFKIYKSALVTFLVLLLVLAAFQFDWVSRGNERIRAGFPSEFIERGDGYVGLQRAYNLDFDVNELAIGLMYDAVKSGNVDVISGFSTDGRIMAYDLILLEDDKSYFPPYHAAPLIRAEVHQKYPEVLATLNLLEEKISDSLMAALNYRIDEHHTPIRMVAEDFVKEAGFTVVPPREGEADIQVGSKDFTESYLLAHIFKIMIEGQTGLTVELNLGFGGTRLLFEALAQGDIDLYPEYTGTGLLVILPESKRVPDLAYDKEQVYSYVSKTFLHDYGLIWGHPLGFNNTFALMMRREYAEEKGIGKISDLSIDNAR